MGGPWFDEPKDVLGWLKWLPLLAVAPLFRRVVSLAPANHRPRAMTAAIVVLLPLLLPLLLLSSLIGVAEWLWRQAARRVSRRPGSGAGGARAFPR